MLSSTVQVLYSMILASNTTCNLLVDNDNDDDDAAMIAVDNDNDDDDAAMIAADNNHNNDNNYNYGKDCRMLKGATMIMIVLLMKACIESYRDISFVFFLFWITTTDGI